jgi:hypothetical protein
VWVPNLTFSLQHHLKKSNIKQHYDSFGKWNGTLITLLRAWCFRAIIIWQDQLACVVGKLCSYLYIYLFIIF